MATTTDNEFDDDILLEDEHDEVIEDEPEDETLEADEPEDEEPEAKAKRPMKEWLKEDLAAERKRRQQAEARLVELERQAAEREAAAAESEIAAAKAAWQEAYRADDAEGLESANAKLVAAQVKAATRKAPAAEPTESQAPPAAVAWVERNAWFRQDETKTARAMEINNALLEEGLDPNHPRFYAEIDRRLRATPRMNGPKTIGGVTRDSPRSVEKKTLTKSDIKDIRDFGMDPNDPKVRKGWLISKRRADEAKR